MKYAMLFPGQGSQAVGMLNALAAAHGEVAATFDEASRVLGWDLGKLVREGPAEELNKTERTQPALLAAGVAVWRVWQAQKAPAPAALAGHSLGEYTALVAAGSVAFGDALKVVELRGQLMQQAVPAGTGGMLAVIGMEDAAIEKFCGDYKNSGGEGVLEPVNYNAPGQVVLAGSTPALDWAEGNAKGAGARMVVRLPVSVPSHCSLMRGAADKLAGRLAHVVIHEPAIPVLHNLDAKPRATADEIRAALKDQLFRPVRWSQTVQALVQQGVGAFFECGPGKVLMGLNKRIAGKMPGFTLEDPASLAGAVSLVGKVGAGEQGA